MCTLGNQGTAERAFRSISAGVQNPQRCLWAASPDDRQQLHEAGCSGTRSVLFLYSAVAYFVSWSHHSLPPAALLLSTGSLSGPGKQSQNPSPSPSLKAETGESQGQSQPGLHSVTLGRMGITSKLVSGFR